MPNIQLQKLSSRPKSVGSVLFVLYTGMIFIFLFLVTIVALRSSHGSNFFPSPMFRYVAFGVQDEWSTPGYCPPAVNIFFLKTHKCASSTVQNILMRYGDEKNLTFVLPEESNYIGHPKKFSRSLLTEQVKMYSNFNLLCHHLRFDAHEIESVMSPKTFYVSILRDPGALFRSMYDYYNMQHFFNRTLKSFLQDEGSMKTLNSQRIYDKLGRNQMFFDFGYDKDIWDNVSLIRSAIEEIDEKFDFIMISELFDESLILLKHMLCWTTADIVYLKHNMRKKTIFTSIKMTLWLLKLRITMPLINFFTIISTKSFLVLSNRLAKIEWRKKYKI
ncbi:galactose-3-O-sulfotransferase 4-like isoform X2 [Uloborus diversus]|uniref:galactose-3-O-sulfotransferase 4-like isoform X2 n=1 Tax=Uloborus diversus TaxID=327109 RepID=UPI002409AE18|nr:galactose-3-O-sulfotransferase 4-like isoform X2 [Uloborus diversus]